jgi:hypothetical protein
MFFASFAAIGRIIPAFAILFRPHRAIGCCSFQILKTLKVRYTSLMILIPGYRISILLPIGVSLLLEKC